MDYIDRLIKNCETAKRAIPVNEFILNDLTELDGIKKAIYIIEQVGGDIEKTFNELVEYKSKKERACPKLNNPSKVMYVGSSTTGIKRRIKEHVGQGYKNTSSLHLSHWYTEDYKITVREYDVSNEILQILEDALYHKLKPAFGKLGGNNK